MLYECIAAPAMNGTVMVGFRPLEPLHPKEHVTAQFAVERGEYKRGDIYKITIENITAMSP